MLDKNNIPKHVAIIMDGNGRWAKERNLPRSAGHRAGIHRVKEIVKAADELGIKALTLFAFSAENWERPKQEVNMLMRALNRFLGLELKGLIKNNVRLLVIGREEPLPKYLRDKIKEAQGKTKLNTGLTLVLALNYGSRQEIVDAAKKFAKSVIKGEVDLEGMDTAAFGNYFYTSGLPDPDLFIRTSGEMRISNFLLWQLSYAELLFPKKYWPDFGKNDFIEAIKAYQDRERRFGKVSEATTYGVRRTT